MRKTCQRRTAIFLPDLGDHPMQIRYESSSQKLLNGLPHGLITILFFVTFRLIDWTRCKTNSAVFVRNPLLGFTLEPSPAKAASPSSAGPATTRLSFKNARTTTSASSTRRTGLPAKLADSGNA